MKTWHWLLTGILILGTFWYYYHKTCPACQEKWNMLKNRLGQRLIEPKP